MLKNTFRKITGGLIVAVFALAVYRYAQQTKDSEFVGAAIADGLKLLLVLGLVLYGAYLFDRRINKREQQ